VEGDPINHNDPSGLLTCSIDGVTVGCNQIPQRLGGPGLGEDWDCRPPVVNGFAPVPNIYCRVPMLSVPFVAVVLGDDEAQQRIPSALNVSYDCYRADGTQLTIGYTRVIQYQVVDQYVDPFIASDVPTVREIITTKTGPIVQGGSTWERRNNSIDSNGRFVDFLSANGNRPSTAEQTFTAISGNQSYSLKVNIGQGSPTVLNNSYSRAGVTVNSTEAPRPCTDS
jgi:hypothetical protein